MDRLASLWRSTIGLKIVMGATGLIMVAFLIGHLAGNLLVFWGPAAINGYGRALRLHPVLLWTARAVLIASVLLHIAAAALLTVRDLRARPVGYARLRPQATTLGARTMRWTGVLLALFIVFHLLHLTTGTIRPAPYDGPNIYANVVGGFHVPWVVALYVVGMLLLALHLYHGIWASLRTLGISPLAPSPLRRPLGGTLTVVLWIGFTLIPLAIVAGVVG